MNKIHASKISWISSTPTSERFNDFYFSSDGGLSESRAVFLNHNNLKARFSMQSSFVIAETGFGTGLNFLSAWQLFNNSSSTSSQLHFISAEKYPLSKCDLHKALLLWPELNHLSEQLINQYPEPVQGFHRLSFEGGRINLTLMFGDALDCYSQLDAKIDAWFLDGFAPSKNPDMWTPELFNQMARLSKRDTTFSTFTCADIVKRGLSGAGFHIKKVPGFGKKREMLTGIFISNNRPSAQNISPPWFQIPDPLQVKTVTIIGAGVAGCSTAYALAQRGWQVTLVDRNPQIAAEGSGNRQGALYAKLPVEPIPASRFHLSGFLYSSNFLKQNLPDRSDIWSPCGLLQLAATDKERRKQLKLVESENYPESVVRYAEQSEASSLAGISVNSGGLFFPQAGWVTPPFLCEWLTQQPNISVITDTEITQLQRQEEQWSALTSDNKRLVSDIVVVASAADSAQFEQLSHLPVQNIRGQVSLTRPYDEALQLNTVLCSEGYISPAKEGRFCFGATFDLKDDSIDIRESGHQHNLHKMTDMAPELADHLKDYHDKYGLEGRVGFRCASPDKLPVIGPAPVYDAFIEDYAALRHDAKKAINTPATHYPGLFVNLAHGSKGLISGPISGEIIASMLENQPLPLEKELIDKLNPARFIIKNLIRRTI